MSNVSEHDTKTAMRDESAFDVDTLIGNFCADAGELARTSLDSPEFGVLVLAGREGSSEYWSELFDRKEAAGVSTAAWMAFGIEAFISSSVSLPSVMALASPVWIGVKDGPLARVADGVLLRVFDLDSDGDWRDFLAFRTGGDSDGVQLTPWWVETVGFGRAVMSRAVGTCEDDDE